MAVPITAYTNLMMVECSIEGDSMRFLFCLLPFLSFAQNYDVVVRNGRVLDPESGLDGVRYIGIKGRQIAAVSTRPISGKVELDASGLIVAPGFIDLHSHGQTPENYRCKAMDGVTTALDLERGASPIAGFYEALRGKALIHFGASADYTGRRMIVQKDTGKTTPLDAAKSPTTAEDRSAIENGLRNDFQSGALGLGLVFFYSPLTAEETVGLFRVAADYKRPVFAHLRDTGVYESLQEVIANSVISGAPLHIAHVNSFLTNVPKALRVIDDARSHGLDVTTEALPYNSAGVFIESPMFAPGWQQRLHSDYSDLVWQATGEHLNAESFERYRKQGGRVIATVNTEETIRTALSHPKVMVASDGNLQNGRGHPRSAGTFARVMGKYVREEKALSLMEAVRKCTLLPAQRLERSTPQMLRKGRIKVGADADIIVFNADRIIDRATMDNPARYSEGMRYVLVDGVLVVSEGQIRDGVFPGEGIRAR